MTALPDVAKLPSVSRLHELFRYDPATGKLFWRLRNGPPKQVNQWNSANAGREAGWLEPNGYWRVKVDEEFVLAHRVIWAMDKGAWPTIEIDHVDQNRSNNLLANLQEAGPQLNSINKTMSRANTSGCTGVHRSSSGKWVAAIRFERKLEYLGTFSSFDDAVAARKQAEKRHGFSPNHGRARA